MSAPLTHKPANTTIVIGPERCFLDTALQPFLLQTGSGRLLVTAQLPVPLGTAFPGVWATSVSDDQGASWRSWSDPTIPGGSPFFEGCACALADGEILMLPHSFKQERDGWWTALLYSSRDNWRSARAEPARLYLPQAETGFDDDGHPAGDVFLHRSLLELPGGELLLSAYCWFTGDDIPSTYRATMNKFRTIALASSDRGRTWALRATVAAEPFPHEEGFGEPVFCRLTKGGHAGRLLALLRTGSNKTLRHNPIYSTWSDDQGRTWSPPQDTGLVGNVDPDLIELTSGALLASFGWRTFESRVNQDSTPKTIGKGHGNWVALSNDQGQSWTAQTQVTAEPSTCYTCIREVAPGRVLIVYDIGDGWHHVWIGHEKIARGLGCRILEI